MLLKLWTVRPASDYALLQTQGVYVADERFVLPEWRCAYQWMADQLAKKVPPPAGVTVPVWAWYRAHGSLRPKPDLRRSGHLAKGQKGVRIECVLPAEQVLLSSFDGWHAVLNNHCLSLDDAEYENHEHLARTLSAEAFERVKQQSWQGIFDLNLLPDPKIYEVQAVFWQLPWSAVVRVDDFTAR